VSTRAISRSIDERIKTLEATVDALTAARDRYKADAERVRDVLREVQWSDDDCCPICSAAFRPGAHHAPYCALAAALKGTT